MTLTGVATTVLRPAADLAALGVRAERSARRMVSRSAERAALAALDAGLASPAAERAVDRVLASPLLERTFARALEGPELERIVAATLESPGAARLADRVLDSPQAERLVARVIESRLVDEAAARLLESKDLWLLVDEIARSPSVTQAISHQGVGFAEELAGVVRTRSQSADARVERLARRLFRREVADGHDA